MAEQFQPSTPLYIVEAEHLAFVRGGVSILNDVSWRIAPRQHWALLGANGSGKTTLLKILTGYEWATRGAVRVLGERFGACRLQELRKHIGWVSTALEQRLPGGDTGLEVVVSGFDASIGLYRYPEAWEAERAREALRLVGGEGLAEQAFGVMSQGEQQRVLIARALSTRPSLLILDEPCGGLDPASRERFLADLEHLALLEDGPTIVFVTHHVEEIGNWVQRVLILKNGHVCAEGATDDTLNDAVLTEAFSLPCAVDSSHGRYWLRMLPA